MATRKRKISDASTRVTRQRGRGRVNMGFIRQGKKGRSCGAGDGFRWGVGGVLVDGDGICGRWGRRGIPYAGPTMGRPGNG